MGRMFFGLFNIVYINVLVFLSKYVIQFYFVMYVCIYLLMYFLRLCFCIFGAMEDLFNVL